MFPILYHTVTFFISHFRSQSRGNEELKDSVFNREYERPKSIITDKPPISPPPAPPLPPDWSRPKIKEPIAVQINCSPSVPNIQVLPPTPGLKMLFVTIRDEMGRSHSSREAGLGFFMALKMIRQGPRF